MKFGRTGLVALSMSLSFSVAHANPINPRVVAGNATFETSSQLLEVSNTPGTIINWQDFSIASDETTRFIQQSAASAVLNRVTGSAISEVLGSLESNGQVFVINPNGLLIGENAVINTAGFVGSTLDIDDQAFLNQNYQYAGHSGVLENRGLIRVTGSGDVVLMGTSVANSGVIRTEDGDVLLAAGRNISLAYDDLDHIVFKLRAAADTAMNLGEIIAQGGNVALSGGAVQQAGNIQLVRSIDGRIFLQSQGDTNVSGSMAAPGGQIDVLGDHITLNQANLTTTSSDDGGQILIGGDYQGGNDVQTARITTVDASSTVSANALDQGNGGRIIVWSNEYTRFDGHLSARADGSSGDGGFIETSSAGELNVSGTVSVAATAGNAGDWLLDPEDILIDEGMAASIEGTLNEGGNVTVKTADQGDGEGNITVQAAITKTAGDDANLTLDAHNDIAINAPIRSESNKLDVTLQAGRSVSVNAEITTNGGNVATLIKSTESSEITSEDESISIEAEAAIVSSETEATDESTIAEIEPQDSEPLGAENEQIESDSDDLLTNIDQDNSDSNSGVATNDSDQIDVEVASSDSSIDAENSDSDTENLEPQQTAMEGQDEMVAEVVSETISDEVSDTENLEPQQAAMEGQDEIVAEVVSETIRDEGSVTPEASEATAVEEGLESTIASSVSDSVEPAELPAPDAPSVDETLEEVVIVENLSERVQVTISAAIDTAGGNIDVNTGSLGDVVIEAALGASNSAANQTGGSINIDSGTFISTADIASTGIEQGGNISINAEQSAALGGDLIVDGNVGGQVEINTGHLSLAETISAQGNEGQGGSVEIYAATQTVETNSSTIDVSGASGGSIRHVASQQITSSGNYTAIGTAGEGGTVDISAPGTKLLSATIDASGETAGGTVRIGGEYQGGKDLTTDELPNAVLLAVNDGVEIRADGLGEGSDGGDVVLWADQEAAVYGTVSAAQNRTGSEVGAGGFVEISSGDVLTYAGDVTAGLGGTVLFDPKNIIIDDAPQSSQYSLLLGFNYDPALTSLDSSDFFGHNVSLSSDGTRLAVGSVFDDGFGNTAVNAGAVYLFSFTDGNFSGGVLESTIGKGYVGGKNMDIANLESGDSFGTSVSFDADGDSLAIGAWQDRGRLNSTGINTGAVYLIKFTDTDFNNGAVEAIFGGNYGLSGGKNRSFGTGSESQNGRGVALNAAGDRLAIGAVGDNRFPTSNFYEGAVYLFTFTDEQFSGGTQVSKIADFSPSGNPAPGANDLNLTFLDQNDYFGENLDLNAAGDRLVVSAIGDDGFGQSGFNPLTGAVHMFSFSDTSFSNPTLEGTIGLGYTGGKNFDPGDIAQGGVEFGTSVSINDAGDRIAIAGDLDDGFGDTLSNSGIIRIIDFSDTSFSGAVEERRIGFGYTGGNNVDVSDLENSDRIADVALNGAGDRLVGGYFLDDGAANAAPNAGAVRFFDLNLPGDSTGDVADAVFATSPGSLVTITPTSITDITNTGSAVVLQANNDISVISAIIADNPAGDGGDLSLHAGRSITIDNEINTDNGNFTAIANETLANGAVDSERDPGAAGIFVNADISTGSGDILLSVADDPAKNDNSRGVISVQSTVSGNNVTVAQGNDLLLGSASNSTASLINAAANVDLNIDGLFSAQGGNTALADATIDANGSVTIQAGEIEFSGDLGVRGVTSDSIELDSNSTILVQGGELNANQNITIASVGDTLLRRSGANQNTSIQSNTGLIDISSDATLSIINGSQVNAAAGNIMINTGQDFNLGDGLNDGVHNITGGGNLEVIADGAINLLGGSQGPSQGSAVVNVAGNASLVATQDISFIGGSSTDSNVLVTAADINIDAGGNLLLQGGSADNTDVLLDSNGTANINAVGDVTVQGGSATNTHAVVYSDSLNTINIDAANVSLLSGTGQGLLNVLDGASGSTVNITTPGNCVNCVQVGLLDNEGVVADVVNIFGQPTPPVEPPVVEPPVVEPPIVEPPIVEPPVAGPPTVEPPIVEPPVVEPPIVEPPVAGPPTVEPPVAEPPVVDPPVVEPPIAQPPAPAPTPIPQPEEGEQPLTPEAPNDVINDVVVIAENDDTRANDNPQATASIDSDEEEEGETEEENPTQCQA